MRLGAALGSAEGLSLRTRSSQGTAWAEPHVFRCTAQLAPDWRYPDFPGLLQSLLTTPAVCQETAAPSLRAVCFAKQSPAHNYAEVASAKLRPRNDNGTDFATALPVPNIALHYRPVHGRIAVFMGMWRDRRPCFSNDLLRKVIQEIPCRPLLGTGSQ
jgi:hypothetical protein